MYPRPRPRTPVSLVDEKKKKVAQSSLSSMTFFFFMIFFPQFLVFVLVHLIDVLDCCSIYCFFFVGYEGCLNKYKYVGYFTECKYSNLHCVVMVSIYSLPHHVSANDRIMEVYAHDYGISVSMTFCEKLNTPVDFNAVAKFAGLVAGQHTHTNRTYRGHTSSRHYITSKCNYMLMLYMLNSH